MRDSPNKPARHPVVEAARRDLSEPPSASRPYAPAGRLLLDYARRPPTTPGGWAALAEGLAAHAAVAGKAGAQVGGEDGRSLLLLELDLNTAAADAAGKGVVTAGRRVRKDDALATPTLADWSAVHGDEAALCWAHDRFDVPGEDLTDLAVRCRRAKNEAARKQALQERRRHQRRVELARRFKKANALILTRMPRCFRASALARQAPRLIHLDDGPGKTTRDPKKRFKRAVYPHSICSPDTNGWDNIVNTFEEHRDAYDP